MAAGIRKIKDVTYIFKQLGKLLYNKFPDHYFFHFGPILDYNYYVNEYKKCLDELFTSY